MLVIRELAVTIMIKYLFVVVKEEKKMGGGEDVQLLRESEDMIFF